VPEITKLSQTTCTGYYFQTHLFMNDDATSTKYMYSH